MDTTGTGGDLYGPCFHNVLNFGYAQVELDVITYTGIDGTAINENLVAQIERRRGGLTVTPQNVDAVVYFITPAAELDELSVSGEVRTKGEKEEGGRRRKEEGRRRKEGGRRKGRNGSSREAKQSEVKSSINFPRHGSSGCFQSA
jgi:hypothetical protein